jgi:hypothetical protein
VKAYVSFAIAALLITPGIVGAQAQLLKPPKPTRTVPTAACDRLSASETSVSQLASRISGAQIAYLTLRSEGDGKSTTVRQCEAVVLDGFERLGKFNTQAAAEAVVKLVLDRELSWDFSDRSVIATHIATGAVGPLASRLLRPHVGESNLVKDIISCDGAKTCM